MTGLDDQQVVTYERRDHTAIVTMNRPEYRNAQNGAMTYALDDAFSRAVDDDEVKVIVLAGSGEHFSAGHDIGTPARDADRSYDRRAVIWWDHTERAGRTVGSPGKARSTWECAGGGAKSPSRWSPRCRAPASPGD